jgi:branched-chain amino acid transport system permease protein
VIVPLVALGLVFLPFDLRGALINSLIGSVIALSLVVIVGFAGQISLMQMTLAGLAGLFMTRLSGTWGVPFPLDGAIAIAVAGLVGIVVGLPALRIRGVQLAVLTLGAAYAVERMVFANPSILRAVDVSGSVKPPSLFGFHFSVNGSFPIGSRGAPNATFGLFLLVAVAFAFVVVIALRRSDLGRQWLAVRANERAAAGLGINVAAAKLTAFAIASCLAGAAGVLTAYQFQGVGAAPYVALASVAVLATAYLGGIGTVSGAVVAGTLAIGGLSFRLLDRILHLGKYELLISGIGLLVTAVMNPEGIAGVIRVTTERITAGRRSAAGQRTEAPTVGATDDPAPARL